MPFGYFQILPKVVSQWYIMFGKKIPWKYLSLKYYEQCVSEIVLKIGQYLTRNDKKLVA